MNENTSRYHHISRKEMKSFNQVVSFSSNTPPSFYFEISWNRQKNSNEKSKWWASREAFSVTIATIAQLLFSVCWRKKGRKKSLSPMFCTWVCVCVCVNGGLMLDVVNHVALFSGPAGKRQGVPVNRADSVKERDRKKKSFFLSRRPAKAFTALQS